VPNHFKEQTMYGTKLAQMPNDLPMGLGERLPRAEEVRAADTARKEAIKASNRKVLFELHDQTFNHELAKQQNDDFYRRHAEARRAEEAEEAQKAKEEPVGSSSEITRSFIQATSIYKAAGGKELRLSDLASAFIKKMGGPFTRWTASRLAEFEQFAGQVGAEEAAARARSTIKVGNAPRFVAFDIESAPVLADRYNW
jgi:hypothetical protein